MENDYNTRILSNRTFQHKNFIILGIIILFSSCGNSNEELNKGFDFNFGTNLTLQISIKDILKGLTNNSNNSVFNKSLVDTDNSFITSDDTYLNLFFDTFDNIKGDTKLTDPSIFLNKTTSGFIDFQMTDDEVRSVLIRKIDESIIYTIDVLKKRIDNLGVTQSKIKGKCLFYRQ